MKILLCCSVGVSSSIYIKFLREEFEVRQLDYKIAAIGLYEFQNYVREANLVLLAPHISFKQIEFQSICDNLNIPLIQLSIEEYGFGNRQHMVTRIQNAMGQF